MGDVLRAQMWVRINAGSWVDAQEVESVHDHDGCTIVTMRSGSKLWANRNAESLVRAIDDAVVSLIRGGK